jgi:hypothetical protein
MTKRFRFVAAPALAALVAVICVAGSQAMVQSATGSSKA